MPHDVVVGAGGQIEKGHPLAHLGLGESKALLSVAGRPMLQWVLDAISRSDELGRVFLVGLDKNVHISCSKPIHFVAPQLTALDSLLAGAAAVKQHGPSHPIVLWVAADVPLVQPHMLDWFARAARKTSFDLFFPTIDPELFSSRFPSARRTRFRLRDRSFYVGDVAAFHSRMSRSGHKGLLHQLARVNRSPWRMARTVGPLTLLRFLARRLTVQDCLQIAGSRLNINATVIECPWPEMGMDVDRPEHYELVCKELESSNADRAVLGLGPA